MPRRFRTISKSPLFSRLEQMKQNLIRLLVQANIENPEQVIGQVASLDLTGSSGKYLLTPWVISQIASKTIIWPEDSPRVKQAIEFWWSNKHKLSRDKRQITKLHTIHDLEDWQEQIQPSRREVIREHKTKGAEVLFSSTPYTLLKITTPGAAEIYGRGTRWCTTNSKTCMYYLFDGPLFILQKMGLPYFQYHRESGQFKQADDRDVTDEQNQELISILRFGGLLDTVFKLYLEVNEFSTEELEQIVDNSLYSYLYSSNILEEPFPAGEAAISRDAQCSYRYARNVLRAPFQEGEAAISGCAHCSYWYARDVLKGPFPAGETAISGSDMNSYLYARNVLKGAFPEGEPVISGDAMFSYLYARDVLQAPFSAGEAAISGSAEYSYLYAKDVLRAPFPAGEAAISGSAKYSYCYALVVLMGPFLTGEPAISGSAEYSYWYARFILNKSFPAGEAAISGSAEYSYRYARSVLKRPFPAGEPAISGDVEYSYLYVRDVLLDPHIEVWRNRYLAKSKVLT